MARVVLEFFWPEGERPGWALRWDVDHTEAHVEVCSATGSSPDKPEDDIVLCGSGNFVSLDGPWHKELSVAVRFDGYARMWCEDLQLGTSPGIANLMPLFEHIYSKAEELIRDASALHEEWLKRRLLELGEP